MARAHNFNAGPAALPLAVLQQAQEEFVDFRGSGMSIMEMSHRGGVYESVHDETVAAFKRVLGIPDGYSVLFLQGGASTQFGMIPMNLLGQDQTACYVHTGSWAEKAIKDAKLIGKTAVVASAEENQFTAVPQLTGLALPQDAAYMHVTSNETIGGIQFQSFPDTGSVPLIADMSSDILSRPIDVSQFGMIYAGAQKNLGPSGVTVVVARTELLAASPKHLPVMLRYNTHLDNNSLYNTPPSFSIYIVGLVLQWIEKQGGLQAVQANNVEKSSLIYRAIDESAGFYRGVAAADSRSMMNITFRLATEELEKAFVKQSEAAGFIGLKGHRSVGGLRASAYNAVPYESCKALADFMADFQRKNS